MFLQSCLQACVCRSLRPASHGKAQFNLCQNKGKKTLFWFLVLIEDPDCVLSQQDSRWHRCLGVEVLAWGPEMSKQGPLAGLGAASGPYINHHMSSCLIKYVQFVLLSSNAEWQQINLPILYRQHFITVRQARSFRLDKLIQSKLCVLRVLCCPWLYLWAFWLCPRCVTAQFKARNVFSRQAAFRS